jgi:hypothetical protein
MQASRTCCTLPQARLCSRALQKAASARSSAVMASLRALLSFVPEPTTYPIGIEMLDSVRELSVRSDLKSSSALRRTC